jgi:aldose sugar dehydrogenase
MLVIMILNAGCSGGFKTRGDQGSDDPVKAPEPAPAPRPAQTGPANAPDQEPAFPAQTRAPRPAEPTAWRQEDVASGLVHPWALEVLPDGRLLVTERPGRMRIVGLDGTLGEPLAGLPEVFDRDQGGLLDVALAPDFGTSRSIFWSYSEPRGGGENGTSVATGTLAADERSVEGASVIFRQQPAWDSSKHFGSRLVFAPDGTLFVTLGERFFPEPRQHAQLITDHIGTVVRIRPDGSVPEDNPFVEREDARPEIWSYGHRNVQSAALDAQGRLWIVEHGPQGGDELNRPVAGENYGWPVITYGESYGGDPVGEGLTAKEGMEQPVYYWDPVIAPSGMALYEGDRFPGWDGDFLVGGLVARSVVRLSLADDRVQTEEWLELGARVRDVRVAPDGSVLALTDEQDGRVVRIVPAR